MALIAWECSQLQLTVVRGSRVVRQTDANVVAFRQGRCIRGKLLEARLQTTNGAGRQGGRKEGD